MVRLIVCMRRRRKHTEHLFGLSGVSMLDTGSRTRVTFGDGETGRDLGRDRSRVRSKVTARGIETLACIWSRYDII